MPILGSAAVSGMNTFIKDVHELDCSPTKTPAQTRSTSPIKGLNLPEGHREAAEFVTKLTSMATQASNTIDNVGRVKTGNEMVSSAQLPNATTTNNQHTISNNLDKHTVTHNSDIQNPIARSSTDKTTTEIVSSVLTPTATQAKMGGLVKVSATDGSSSVSTTSKLQILLVYFLFNLGLTLYNKAVMIMVSAMLKPPDAIRLANGVLSFVTRSCLRLSMLPAGWPVRSFCWLEVFSLLRICHVETPLSCRRSPFFTPPISLSQTFLCESTYHDILTRSLIQDAEPWSPSHFTRLCAR